MASIEQTQSRLAVRTSKLQWLEDLIAELIKAKPRESVVQKLMEASGIEYSRDPVMRMQTVLRAIDTHIAEPIEARTSIEFRAKEESKERNRKPIEEESL